MHYMRYNYPSIAYCTNWSTLISLDMQDEGASRNEWERKKEGDHFSSFLFYFHKSPFSVNITMVSHNLVPRVSRGPVERETGKRRRETLETRLVLLLHCPKQQRELVVTHDTSSL